MKVISRCFSNVYVICFVLVMIIFIISRFVFLESDLPDWSSYNYQPLGEGFYVKSALDFFHHGSLTLVKLLGEYAETVKLDLLNIVVACTLKFGANNYYGLRGGMLLLSVVSFFFFSILLKTIINQRSGDGGSKILTTILFVGCMLIYALTPANILVSVVVEPTGVRILGTLFFLLAGVYLMEKECTVKNLISFGIVTGFCISFIHIILCFLFVAGIICVFDWEPGRASSKTEKSRFRRVGLYVASSILTMAFFAICVFALNTKIGGGLQVPLSSFFDRVNWGDSFLMNIIFAIKTAFLRDNPLLFVAFIPFCLVVRKANIAQYRAVKIVYNCFFALLLQLFFINDYPVRKDVLLFPIVILILADNLSILIRVTGEGIYLDGRKLLVCALIGTFILGCANTSTAGAFYKEHFYSIGILLFGILCMALATMTSIKLEVIRIIGICCIMLALLWAPLWGYQDLFTNRSFKLKDTMIKLGRIMDRRQIAFGSWSYSLALYGRWKPLGNAYVHQYIPGSQNQQLKRLGKSNYKEWFVIRDAMSAENCKRVAKIKDSGVDGVLRVYKCHFTE